MTKVERKGARVDALMQQLLGAPWAPPPPPQPTEDRDCLFMRWCE